MNIHVRTTYTETPKRNWGHTFGLARLPKAIKVTHYNNNPHRYLMMITRTLNDEKIITACLHDAPVSGLGVLAPETGPQVGF